MKGLPDKRQLLEQVKPHRESWDAGFRPSDLEPVGQGEESVWDYPRPPILQLAPIELTVRFEETFIARSSRALELKETAGAPCPYFPPDDVQRDWLIPNGRLSVCEWKGVAVEFDLAVPDGPTLHGAAWMYPDPFDDLPEGYAEIAGWIAFYPAKVACFAGEERVRPQPGGLYGGWVTDRIKGPLKGSPGTGHW
ncbi:DUF427 domain-containing protein [Parerythrobacter jejuensis]|uniref:DUF427 domain-containing protein n=1 Tax=Parerythrobacter jejuensis TaxID=795812 RepID=A0A845ALM4_9SPHN|nr:DUF427 domain-containing protein [Parerythrobacter jejuensis]MXP30317.1 DUF427 domain-containing protein [Parerythrobacter jejuensis]MXP33077.1 DUF427 domain-containing protein [Parerythrobacter jejuensis]